MAYGYFETLCQVDIITMKKINLVIIITDLVVGGAEVMLFKLLTGLDMTRFQVSVISLMDKGSLGDQMGKIGVEIYEANMRKNLSAFSRFFKLIKIVKKINPDILCGWMYHANFISFLLSFFVKSAKLIWNVRQTNTDASSLKLSTRAIVKICGLLSSFRVVKIIYCAKSAALTHEAFGYSPRKTVVIPNGFDMNVFVYDENVRNLIRDELRISKESKVVGICARYHLVKDYATFINAAKLLIEQESDIYIVCCGRGVDWNNADITSLLEKDALTKRFYLLGERTDVSRILNVFDIVVSSSIVEGFSNAIGEAMASGVPCVVTDVGDSAEIVDDKLLVVPMKNPTLLASAILRVLKLSVDEKKELSRSVREKIERRYSIANVVNLYQDLFISLVRF